ncbi:hypothetical protein ABH931_007548 [Streptacidiphilus sp. MAP12-33]|uniref:hypothetical protein n=1 Tax=Streptacidiphilus sp. MAP12-33 TaxID=3156266 RepID=UPI0035185B83
MADVSVVGPDGGGSIRLGPTRVAAIIARVASWQTRTVRSRCSVATATRSTGSRESATDASASSGVGVCPAVAW